MTIHRRDIACRHGRIESSEHLTQRLPKGARLASVDAGEQVSKAGLDNGKVTLQREQARIGSGLLVPLGQYDPKHFAIFSCLGLWEAETAGRLAPVHVTDVPAWRWRFAPTLATAFRGGGTL